MRRCERGLTLIELVIAITVISIAVTAVVGALSLVVSHSADAMLREQAVAVAESYLEEIELRPMIDPTPSQPAPSSRALFRTVANYNGLSDTGAHDQNGNPIGALSAYNVSVAVVPSSGLNGLGSGLVDRIDVTVSYPTGKTLTLSGMRAAYW